MEWCIAEPTACAMLRSRLQPIAAVDRLLDRLAGNRRCCRSSSATLALPAAPVSARLPALPATALALCDAFHACSLSASLTLCHRSRLANRTRCRLSSGHCVHGLIHAFLEQSLHALHALRRPSPSRALPPVHAGCVCACNLALCQDLEVLGCWTCFAARDDGGFGALMPGSWASTCCCARRQGRAADEPSGGGSMGSIRANRAVRHSPPPACTFTSRCRSCRPGKGRQGFSPPGGSTQGGRLRAQSAAIVHVCAVEGFGGLAARSVLSGPRGTPHSARQTPPADFKKDATSCECVWADRWLICQCCGQRRQRRRCGTLPLHWACCLPPICPRPTAFSLFDTPLQHPIQMVTRRPAAPCRGWLMCRRRWPGNSSAERPRPNLATQVRTTCGLACGWWLETGSSKWVLRRSVAASQLSRRIEAAQRTTPAAFSHTRVACHAADGSGRTLPAALLSLGCQ